MYFYCEGDLNSPHLGRWPPHTLTKCTTPCKCRNCNIGTSPVHVGSDLSWLSSLQSASDFWKSWLHHQVLWVFKTVSEESMQKHPGIKSGLIINRHFVAIDARFHQHFLLFPFGNFFKHLELLIFCQYVILLIFVSLLNWPYELSLWPYELTLWLYELTLWPHNLTVWPMNSY